MTPTPGDFHAAAAATWPAAASHRKGPWLIREGQGGGKRVCATTLQGRFRAADLQAAEAAMAALGQDRLFMIRQGDEALDAALARRGYRVVDPVVIQAAPCGELARPKPDPMAAFAHWPPLQSVSEIWADGDIGPARLAVMGRAPDPKTAILGRASDRAAGVAFVAIAGNIATLHALEVRPALRRQGTAVNILRKAAGWAQDHGAAWFSVLVTRANEPANDLYASLGMSIVGQYHYRQK